MKKIFTLIAAAFAAMTVSAQTVVYSWESPEGTPIETGGKIAYVNGDGDRLNYVNGDYHTICLNGKKANLNDADASANAGHMVITLDEALQGGEKMAFTAYYNKGEVKNVSAYILFANGTNMSTSTNWVDIATGATPTTEVVEVPAEAAGSKTITMTRDAAQTNLFITKLVITREGGEGGNEGGNGDTPATGETEKYVVVDLSGEAPALKAEWASNPNVEEESVVELDATPSVHLKAMSGCIGGFVDGPLNEDGTLPKKYDNSWGLGNNRTNQLPEGYDPMYFVNGKGVAYVAYGVEELDSEPGKWRPTYTYYNVDGSKGLPINGVRYILTPKTNGTMKVMFWNNKGSRNIFVANGNTKVALAPADITYSGFVNGKLEDNILIYYADIEKAEGKEYCPQAGINANQAMWGWLTFQVEAGVPYWVFNENAQLGFGGFEFTGTASDGIENIVSEKVNNNVMYSLSGQRINAPVSGQVFIMNGKKYIAK